jgi:hypothetical protein
VPLLILGFGCQTICPDRSRLDGFYVVNAEIDSESAQGQNTDIFFTSDFFLLGWSEWDVTCLAAHQEQDIDGNGQPYSAEPTISNDGCDEFSFMMDGLCPGPESGARYEFSIIADLSISGPKWAGNVVTDVIGHLLMVQKEYP